VIGIRGGGLRMIDENGRAISSFYDRASLIPLKPCKVYVSVLSNNMILSQEQRFASDKFYLYMTNPDTREEKMISTSFTNPSNAVELPHKYFAIADWSDTPYEECMSIYIFDMRDNKKVKEIPLKSAVDRLDVTADGKLIAITQDGKAITIDFEPRKPVIDLTDDPLYSTPRLI
jgi:hypothetical protein